MGHYGDETVPPLPDDLVTEQAEAQAKTHHSRTLGEYTDEIFAGFATREILDFLRTAAGPSFVLSPDTLIEGLSERQPNRPIHWVEMAGGLAIAQRQTAANLQLRDSPAQVTMTNVDLFDWEDHLDTRQLNRMERLSSSLGYTILDRGYRPSFIQADAQTVELPQPADLLTCVQALQYFDNPLQAITNWYNQLQDKGVMIIATELKWTDHISQVDTPPEKLFADFFAQLRQASVHYALDSKLPADFKVLAMQKQAGTRLQLNTGVVSKTSDENFAKSILYQAGPAAIEVVAGSEDTPR